MQSLDLNVIQTLLISCFNILFFTPSHRLAEPGFKCNPDPVNKLFNIIFFTPSHRLAEPGFKCNPDPVNKLFNIIFFTPSHRLAEPGFKCNPKCYCLSEQYRKAMNSILISVLILHFTCHLFPTLSVGMLVVFYPIVFLQIVSQIVLSLVEISPGVPEVGLRWETHARTHAHTHTHTHKNERTHAHTVTHTHTHTHIWYIYITTLLEKCTTLLFFRKPSEFQ